MARMIAALVICTGSGLGMVVAGYLLAMEETRYLVGGLASVGGFYAIGYGLYQFWESIQIRRAIAWHDERERELVEALDSGDYDEPDECYDPDD